MLRADAERDGIGDARHAHRNHDGVELPSVDVATATATIERKAPAPDRAIVAKRAGPVPSCGNRRDVAEEPCRIRRADALLDEHGARLVVVGVSVSELTEGLGPPTAHDAVVAKRAPVLVVAGVEAVVSVTRERADGDVRRVVHELVALGRRRWRRRARVAARVSIVTRIASGVATRIAQGGVAASIDARVFAVARIAAVVGVAAIVGRGVAAEQARAVERRSRSTRDRDGERREPRQVHSMARYHVTSVAPARRERSLLDARRNPSRRVRRDAKDACFRATRAS